MIFLASALNIFIPLITLILVVVALLLILVVLMQKPKNEGLGSAFGGGAMDQAFGAQTTSILQKATVWLGIIFFASTLILSILTIRSNTDKGIQTAGNTTEVVEDGSLSEEMEATGETSSEDESLSDQLQNAINEADSDNAVDAEKDAGSNLLDSAKEAVEGAGDAAGDAVESVKDAAGSAVEGTKDLGSNIIEEAKEKATEVKELVTPTE